MRKRRLVVVINVGLELMDMTDAPLVRTPPPPPPSAWCEGRTADALPPMEAPLVESASFTDIFLGIIMAEAALEELTMVAAIVHR